MRCKQVTASQNRPNSSVTCCFGCRIRVRSELCNAAELQGGELRLARPRWNPGECPMRSPRYDRILASTALALILAAPLSASADTEVPEIAAAPMMAAAQPASEASSRSAAAPSETPAEIKESTAPATPSAPAAAERLPAPAAAPSQEAPAAPK